MLVERRRRWANIEPTLGERLVLSLKSAYDPETLLPSDFHVKLS